jgi:hypothetical protein
MHYKVIVICYKVNFQKNSSYGFPNMSWKRSLKVKGKTSQGFLNNLKKL